MAALKGCQINKRFESGTGLTLCCNSTVELAFCIISTANKCADCAIGRHSHHSALAYILFRTFGLEFRHQRLLSKLLHHRVNAARDYDILFNGADEIIQHIHNPVCGIIA